jgi:hypothetical protein
MFTTSVRWIGLITILVCGASSAQAVPITYAFSGTLSQPYDGSSQFSGTFTYDTDLPVNTNIPPYPDMTYYSGVPADPTEPVLSLTFTLGNTPSSSFGYIDSDELSVTHQPSGSDAFDISEQFIANSGSGSGPSSVFAGIGMTNNNLVQRAPFTSTSPPSSLNLANFSMGASLTVEMNFSNGTGQMYAGTITSLEAVTATPEPASFLVFGILGAGLWVSRRAGLCPRKP